MNFGGIHILDIAVVAAYLLLVLYLGSREARKAQSQEGFFLAGRKLGKVYQFFLNFGRLGRRHCRRYEGGVVQPTTFLSMALTSEVYGVW